MNNTVEQLLNWGTEQLAQHVEAALEAQILLSACLNCERIQLFAWPQRTVEPDVVSEYQSVITRRAGHEPIAYIVGYKEFWSLLFRVTQDTLIPRPETEHLIETVISHLPNTNLLVADVGTGSGNIACALALERPRWHLFATDNSEKALEIAKENAYHLDIHRIRFVLTQYLNGFPPHSLDAIVSNPPYIAEQDPHLAQGDLVYEPTSALVAGPSGLEAFTEIIHQAKSCLKPGGLLAFEHGFDQGPALQALLKEAGFTQIETILDFAGHPRVTLGTLGTCPA